MPLQTSGQISLGEIGLEKGELLSNVSLADISTFGINSSSPLKPDGGAPHAMSEFYGYDHSASSGVNMTLYISNDIYTASSYVEVVVNGSSYTASTGQYPEYTVTVNPGPVDIRVIGADNTFSEGVAVDLMGNTFGESAYGDYYAEINTTITAPNTNFEAYVNGFGTGPVGGGGDLGGGLGEEPRR